MWVFLSPTLGRASSCHHLRRGALHGYGIPPFDVAVRHRLSATVTGRVTTSGRVGGQNFRFRAGAEGSPARFFGQVQKRDLTDMSHSARLLLMIFESILGLLGLVIGGTMVAICVKQYSSEGEQE